MGYMLTSHIGKNSPKAYWHQRFDNQVNWKSERLQFIELENLLRIRKALQLKRYFQKVLSIQFLFPPGKDLNWNSSIELKIGIPTLLLQIYLFCFNQDEKSTKKNFFELISIMAVWKKLKLNNYFYLYSH